MDRPHTNSQLVSLPTEFAAARLACKCFGVNLPELEAALQGLRKKEKNPDEHFPSKINRVMLGKAQKEWIKYSDGLCTVAYQALHGKIRWSWERPFLGPVATIAERIAIDFPRLYADLLPGLRTGKADHRKVWVTLVCDFFLPTFFLELKKAPRRGFGSELRVEDCWYLPKERSQERPFQRVLNSWLNAAGCRYAEDVGKLMSDAERKIVGNWLKGRNLPTAKSIGKVVDFFKDQTTRFDDAEAWKGRLLFAAAMDNLCATIDHPFPGLSCKLLGTLEEIENEPVPIDSDGILADHKTFFAARLIYRRLKTTSEWQRKTADLAKNDPPKIPDSASHKQIEKITQRWESKRNPGNLLMAMIKKEILRISKAQNEMMKNAETFQQQIFTVGVEELNRLLVEKGPVV